MAGTIEINGTGGIIEGNLGSANVNVNLDPIYGNFNGTTSNLSSTSNGFDSIWASAGGYTGAWIYPKSVGETAGRIFDKDKWSLTMSDVANVLEFSVVHGTTTGVWKTGAVVPFNVWTHVGVYYDSDSTGNDPVIYINGVATTITETSTPAGSLTSDASDTFFIGNRADGARTFDGYMMGIQIWKNVQVTAAQAQAIASKINVDAIAMAGVTLPAQHPVGWYKLNSSTTADSSGNSATLTASNMGSVVYDEFHVDVYDNSTTTDGTFTITQGKVEGKALTSLAFDGTDDRVDCGSPSSLDDTFDGTASWGFWIKPDSDGENNFGRVVEKTQWEIYLDDEDNGKTRITLNVNRGTAAGRWISGHIVEIDKWNHILWVYDGSSTSNDPVLYLNGVAQTLTESSTPNGSITSDASSDLHIGNRDGNDRTFDGDIKDVRYYNYLLSAEQAASLYSNTYPQTPNHHWKFDDSIKGTEITTVADSGTETAANGTIGGIGGSGQRGESGVDSGWQNGTLDLDGTLTIAANGSLSAPRGNLVCSAFFLDLGTFTHNSGTVEFDNSSNNYINNDDNASVTAFHNITHSGGARQRYANSVIIENTLDINNGITQFDGSRTGKSMTFGTATQAGSIDLASGKALRPNPPAISGGVTWQGASSLFPCVVTGDDWNWSDGAQETKLANMDFQINIDTSNGGSDNCTLTLTGDCEFDAVTVSSGDTLDLNGQRAVMSGLLTISGDNGLQDAAGDAFLYSNGIIASSATQHSSTSTINYIADNGSNSHKVQYFNFKRFVSTRNGNIDFGRFAPDSTTMDIIVANTGTLSNWGRNGSVSNANSFRDLTIATNATVVPESATLTVRGDFTTSGGLLGASAIDLNGSQQHYSTGSAVAVGTNTAFTIEGWMKRDDGVTGNQVFVELKTASNNNNRVWVNIDSDDVQFIIYDNAGSPAEVVTSGQGLNDGKWHHIACTYDNTTAQVYIDGKLTASGVLNKTQDNTDDRIINVGANVGTYANEFTGAIDEVRIWDDVRTEAEIRSNMFSEVSSGDGLVQNWRFNEGTGDSAAANVGNSLAAKVGGNSASSQGASLWAGSGTFTEGTSTLTMSGSNKFINYNGGVEDIYNLNITGTITLKDLDGGGSSFRLNGDTFTCGSGATLSSNTNEPLRFLNTMDGGTVTFADPATNVANLFKILNSMTSPRSVNIPEVTIPRIQCSGSSTTVATGNHTITEELEVNSGTTFNANGNTIDAKQVDVNGGTLDLRNSTCQFKTTGSNDKLDLSDSSTLLTGNTLIEGHNATNHTFLFAPAAGNFEVVGTLKFMEIQNADGDITVIGSVINCSEEDGFENQAMIRQFHHTLDTQQLLDADEAGDDDLKLEKPALDNAVELQTG